MADRLSPQRRSWNMSRIRGKDTEIEVKVRKYLFAQGFRFRKNVSSLPGKPDIVLPRYKTVIFVHGCYWHRHQGCKNCTTPGSNREFWQEKFAKNIEKDRENEEKLRLAGWKIHILWECEIRNNFLKLMEELTAALKSEGHARQFNQNGLATDSEMSACMD